MIKKLCVTIVSILFLINVKPTLAAENNREIEIKSALSQYFSNDFITTQNFQFGVDHWTGPSRVDNPLLRNMTKTGYYSTAIPWAKYVGSFQPFANDRSNINLHMRTDLDNGYKLDRFDYDFSFTHSIGIRFGLVNMKMNLCRIYEPDNPWIMEPSTSCRITGKSIYRSSNSSPGVQIYLNSFNDTWFFSYQAGYYKPNFLGYDKTEYGFQNYITAYNYFSSIPNQTKQNDKIGFNFQAFNPNHDIDFRLGLILTSSTANSSVFNGQIDNDKFYKVNAEGPQSNQYKIIFSSIRTSVHDKIGITLTFNYYNGSTYTPNQVGTDNFLFIMPSVIQAGGYSNVNVQNFGAEISFPITESSKLVTYIGNAIVNLDEFNYPYKSNKKMISASYRSNFTNGIYCITQAMTGYSDNTYSNDKETVSETTLGFRFGYQF
ncbi:MAG: hypothetical protein ACKN9F_06945 [Methylomonas sp.]